MTDDTTMSADDFLSWLCWSWALDAERFYPPEETAQECMDELTPDVYEAGSDEYERALEWEEGQHCRAFDQARRRFRQAETHNLDPVERAAREMRDINEVAGEEPLRIDWSWYDA